MDSGFSKNMIGKMEDFLSLKAFQGGNISFGNGKKGYILGVGKICKTLEHAIENVFYVNGLKYSLLSMSQICDKGNKVKFLSVACTMTNIQSGEVILIEKRFKSMYVADLDSISGDSLTCLSAVEDNAALWHRRLGHVSFSLLNKLVSKELVRGVPKMKFSENKICDACVKGK